MGVFYFFPLPHAPLRVPVVKNLPTWDRTDQSLCGEPCRTLHAAANSVPPPTGPNRSRSSLHYSRPLAEQDGRWLSACLEVRWRRDSQVRNKVVPLVTTGTTMGIFHDTPPPFGRQTRCTGVLLASNSTKTEKRFPRVIGWIRPSCSHTLVILVIWVNRLAVIIALYVP